MVRQEDQGLWCRLGLQCEYSSSLGFRRLCAEPKAERGLVEHLASMHGALEFISSPKNKEERERWGGGTTRDCLEAESRLSVNYSVVAGWWHPSRLVRVLFCSSQTQVRSFPLQGFL